MGGRLLLLLCVLVMGRAAVLQDSTCQLINLLHGKLLYVNRVQYMQDYFPINYKLYVKYEEVLRCQNITTLINKGITVKELRYLWGIVNDSVLRTIQKVLPLNHPTRPYIEELKTVFLSLLPTMQQVASDQIQEILERLHESEENVKVKAVTPKALLDNCFKVLYALYEDDCALCNPRSDEEDTLCPPGTVPELSSRQRMNCTS